MSNKYILSAAVLVAVMGISVACSCLRSHPQESYCKGSLTFTFRVLKKEYVQVSSLQLAPLSPASVTEDIVVTNPDPLAPSSYRIRYTVKYFKVHQESKDVKKSTSITYIYTNTQSAACGVNLNIDESYAVIGGYYSNKRLSIVSCNHIISLSKLSFDNHYIAAKNIVYKYRLGCKYCKVVNCDFPRDQCKKPKKSTECYTSDLNAVFYDFITTACSPGIFKGRFTCFWSYGDKVIKPMRIPPILSSVQ